MFRINPPERKMRASGRSMCSPQIRIRNQADFDALVRGAMAELSDSGRAPAEITYERVLHLSRSAAAPPTQTAPEPR
jgi:hypothetical protein